MATRRSGLRRAMPESITAAVPEVAAARKRRAVRAAAADDDDEEEEEEKDTEEEEEHESEEEEAKPSARKRRAAGTSTSARASSGGASSSGARSATTPAASASTAAAATTATPAASASTPATAAVLTAGYTGRRALPAAAVTFLRDLAAHNEREWFKAHQGRFDAARDAFVELLQGVTAHLERLDAELGPQDPRASMFRIFRDVRFSADKTPYKTCLSAAFARGGRKSPHACYYIHLQPGGESFVGGGMYMPSNDMLRRLREAIAQGAGSEMQEVLDAPAFKRQFGPSGIFGDHADRLKTAPKGFAKDHPYINLLQLKSFVTGHKIPDALLASPDLLETVIAAFAAMVPLVHLLNSLTGLT